MGIGDFKGAAEMNPLFQPSGFRHDLLVNWPRKDHGSY